MESTNSIGKKLSHEIIATPIGNMVGLASENEIVMLLFEEEAYKFLAEARQLKNWDISESGNDLILKLKLQLDNYFRGEQRNFNLPTDLQGTLFQRRVWDIVQKTPYGTTNTYKDISLKMGSLESIRAVAAANAHNNLLLLIPCHRVIGSGNKLTGYRGGVEKKRWLIEHERENSDIKYNNQLF
jgi:O-6-methylguanine DNA methyltransferase